MRRIIRRTSTVVTVQTWTVTWTEEAATPASALEDDAQALPTGPAPDAPESPQEAPTLDLQAPAPDFQAPALDLPAPDLEAPASLDPAGDAG